MPIKTSINFDNLLNEFNNYLTILGKAKETKRVYISDLKKSFKRAESKEIGSFEELLDSLETGATAD